MIVRVVIAALAVASFAALSHAHDTPGTSYFTSHSFVKPLDPESTHFDDPDIKEWHFHTYWYQTQKASRDAALSLRHKLLQEVTSGKLKVVFNGITNEVFPSLNVSNVPLFNEGPIGPHPIGSFETWVPKEFVAQALSFFMLNRGDLTILVHPLTRHEIEDHTHRAMWLGNVQSIDLTALTPDLGAPPAQYPELGLGYSSAN